MNKVVKNMSRYILERGRIVKANKLLQFSFLISRDNFIIKNKIRPAGQYRLLSNKYVYVSPYQVISEKRTGVTSDKPNSTGLSHETPNLLGDKTNKGNKNDLKIAINKIRSNAKSSFEKDIESAKIINKINNLIDKGMIHKVGGNEASKLNVLPKDSVSGYRKTKESIIKSVEVNLSEKNKENIFSLHKFCDDIEHDLKSKLKPYFFKRRLPNVENLKIELNALDVDNIASVTVFNFLRYFSMNYSCTYLQMSLELGESVMKLLGGQVKGLAFDKIMPGTDFPIEYWTKKNIIDVGFYLLNTLSEINHSFGSSVKRPILTLVPDFVKKEKLLGKVVLEKALSTKLTIDDSILKTYMQPRLHTMQLKPQGCIFNNLGPHLYGDRSYNCIVRKEIQAERMRRNRISERLVDVINGLQSTAWKVNEQILEVVKAISENECNVGGIMKAPSAPLLQNEPVIEDFIDPEEFHRMRLNHILQTRRVNKNFVAQQDKFINTKVRLFCLDRLKEKTFYFPYFTDFRGRVSPQETILNCFQDDVSRGLFYFAEKKPLGIDGIRNLKIHVANLFGNNKTSLDDRIAWVNEQLKNDNIKKNAEAPLEYTSEGGLKKWWCEANEPIQFLAAILELNAALSLPRPEEYLSGLPLQKDGSGNGLQHYCALVRDKTLGSKVNLVGDEVLVDIYSDVRDELVAENDLLLEYFNFRISEQDRHELYLSHNRENSSISKLSLNSEIYSTTEDPKHIIELVKNIERISENEKKLNECYIAWLLQGKITRKVIKQSVMTIPYGVSMIGAADLIVERLAQLNASIKDKHGIQGPSSSIIQANAVLKEPIPTDTMILTELEMGKVSLHLAKQILASKYLLKAKDVKEFLKKMSHRVIKHKNETHKSGGMEWKSALDVEVLQDYRKYIQSCSRVNGKSVTYSVPSLERNRTKEVVAFPANFLHSLEAAHIGETYLALKGKHITFIGQNNSFWTHACDVNTMEQLLRETFIKIHEADQLKNLVKDTNEKFGTNFSLPEYGDLDLNEVRESKYFFN